MREAGKGDKQRLTDKKKFDNNYDVIFKKKPKTPEKQEAIVVLTNMQNELYEKNR